MPTYEFECKSCGFERIEDWTVVEYCVSKPINCVCCGREMLRKYRATAIHDNCPGFFGRSKY
jgi:predicted nucleic acid-binding Zn ribbon protein